MGGLIRRAAWLGPLAIVALIAAVVMLNPPSPQAARVLDCPDLGAGCRFEHDGQTLELGFTGPVRVLQPFEVWLRGAGAPEASARFQMEGMDMGFNRYTLKPGPDGVLRARVTLPVCVSGRRDWRIQLDLAGQEIEARFVTDL